MLYTLALMIITVSSLVSTGVSLYMFRYLKKMEREHFDSRFINYESSDGEEGVESGVKEAGNDSEFDDLACSGSELDEACVELTQDELDVLNVLECVEPCEKSCEYCNGGIYVDEWVAETEMTENNESGKEQKQSMEDKFTGLLNTIMAQSKHTDSGQMIQKTISMIQNLNTADPALVEEMEEFALSKIASQSLQTVRTLNSMADILKKTISDSQRPIVDAASQKLSQIEEKMCEVVDTGTFEDVKGLIQDSENVLNDILEKNSELVKQKLAKLCANPADTFVHLGSASATHLSTSGSTSESGSGKVDHSNMINF